MDESVTFKVLEILIRIAKLGIYFNPDYLLDFFRKEIRQNSKEAYELHKKLLSEVSISSKGNQLNFSYFYSLWFIIHTDWKIEMETIIEHNFLETK
jgi:hypothetical protein